jgi:D-arabinose 1-dehydrogenase-like Zn-dependent alcohol dehydrogenase
MIAARFSGQGSLLHLEEVPVPRPGPEQVLIEVKACGLCGSDLHIVRGETLTAFAPITLGHEAAGVIAELGPGVQGFRVGDRVAVNCVQSCGFCINCQRGRDSICLNRKLLGIHLDGALAPFMVAKARSLIPLPSHVSFEEGAIATDAVATPYHALKTRAKLTASESLAVFGVGGFGTHAVMLGRLMGASPIIAVDVKRPALDRALSVGADYAINAGDADPVRAIQGLTRGRGVEVGLECVGSGQAVRQCVESVAIGGRAAIVGLGPDPMTLGEITSWVRREVTILGCSAFETKEIEEILNLAAARRLDLSKSVTETLSLEEVNKGLELLDKNPGSILRLVVNSF